MQEQLKNDLFPWNPNVPIYRDTFEKEREIADRKLQLERLHGTLTLEKFEKITKEEQKEEKKSAFKSFRQVNEAYDYVIDHLAQQQGGSCFRVFNLLCHHMGVDNKVITTNRDIANLLNCSTRTVDRAIKYLCEHQFIMKNKGGTTNIYVINANLVFKSWGKNHKYAEFANDILLSDIENKKVNELQIKLKDYDIHSLKKSAKKIPALLKQEKVV